VVVVWAWVMEERMTRARSRVVSKEILGVDIVGRDEATSTRDFKCFLGCEGAGSPLKKNTQRSVVDKQQQTEPTYQHSSRCEEKTLFLMTTATTAAALSH
jgi:hypothetical protein